MRNTDITHLLNQKEFDFLIKNGKRNNVAMGYEAKGLHLLPYQFVKHTLASFVESLDFTGLILTYLRYSGHNVFDYEIENLAPNDGMALVCWIFDEYNAIIKLENEYLKGDPDPDLYRAGINRLNQFGDMCLIDALSDGDLLKHDIIRSQPYYVIFDKQLKGMIEGEIQKSLQKIRTENNKLKGGR